MNMSSQKVGTKDILGLIAALSSVFMFGLTIAFHSVVLPFLGLMLAGAAVALRRSASKSKTKPTKFVGQSPDFTKTEVTAKNKPEEEELTKAANAKVKFPKAS